MKYHLRFLLVHYIFRVFCQFLEEYRFLAAYKIAMSTGLSCALFTLHSFVWNNRDGMIIDFGEKFHSRQAYSTHPIIINLKKVPPTPSRTSAGGSVFFLSYSFIGIYVIAKNLMSTFRIESTRNMASIVSII